MEQLITKDDLVKRLSPEQRSALLESLRRLLSYGRAGDQPDWQRYWARMFVRRLEIPEPGDAGSNAGAMTTGAVSVGGPRS